jgi:hypothetical protein
VTRKIPFLALLFFIALGGHPGFAAAPRGPAVDAALVYARALGTGDYAKAYGMLSSAARRYFRTTQNYASVWKAERFSASDFQALNTVIAKNAHVVAIRETIHYYNHGQEREMRGKLVMRYTVVREPSGYRIADDGHPYRSVIPEKSTVDRGGVKLTVAELAFYPRRIEAEVTFENDSSGFVTFLPYGRTVLRDGSAIYRPLVTRNWLLTDRRLFLGLRLAPNARYTGQIDFLTAGRLDDRARTFTLTVAPALREGADQPEEFTLPSIAVPAP